jgi:hypothetical protein
MSKPPGVKTDTFESLNLEAFAEFDIDPSSLDPERHYRVIQQRPGRLARANQQRYQPVATDEGVKSISGRDLGGADGLIRIGDGILMSCPKEIFVERRRQIQRLNQARLSAPEGQFKKKARQAPVNEGRGARINDSKE